MTPVCSFNKASQSEAAAYALETVARLFRRPGQYPHSVVAVTQNVVARRQAMLGAIYLHFIKLRDIKLVIADDTPVMGRRIHREARRQRSIGTND